MLLDIEEPQMTELLAETKEETLPALRRDLIAEPLGDELLVWDPRRRLVHHLDRVAALVFRGCREGSPLRAIEAALLASAGSGAAARALLQATLALLAERHLLEEPPAGLGDASFGLPAWQASRRSFLGGAGKAALALPVLSSIFVPGAAAAVSVVGGVPPVLDSVAIASGERYTYREDQPFRLTSLNPHTTFGADVDTASYANVRRFVTGGQLPPGDAVRIEELLNAFRYADREPEPGDQPHRAAGRRGAGLMPLRLRALDVDLELETGAGETAELLLAMLPPTWERAERREGAPLLLLRFEQRAGTVRLTEEPHLRRDDENPGSWRGEAPPILGSPPSPCPQGEGGRGVRAPRVLATAKTDADPRLWLGRLEQEIVAAVARRSRHLWLHAGAVLLEGRALVLPGPSFAGKSTLVDALVGRGAGYLSDEWVAIDGGGRVHALPRPPRLREATPRSAVPALGDWPLLATAFLRYQARPPSWPRRLTGAEALAELFPHAIGPGTEGGLAAAAALLVRPVFAGFRGDAEDFLDLWLGELAELPHAA